MGIQLGDRVMVVSQRKPAGWKEIKGEVGLVSEIRDATLNNYLKEKIVKVEFFNDKLRNAVNEAGILWEGWELEKLG